MINQKVLDMKCKSYSMHSVESEGHECIFLEQYNDVSEYKMWKLLRRFSDIYVCSTTNFRKENSSTKFNKNPTNRLVAGTMLKMDRWTDGRTNVVFLIYFIKEARKLRIKISLHSSDFRILRLFTYVWDYVGRGISWQHWNVCISCFCRQITTLFLIATKM